MLTFTQVFARPVTLDTPAVAARKVAAALVTARQQGGLPPIGVHDLLDEFANEHIDALPDGVPASAVADIGKQVSSELNARKGHGLGSILIAAQGFFAGEEFVVPRAALTPGTQKYGLATIAGRDGRGRPRVKVLLLLGQVRP